MSSFAPEATPPARLPTRWGEFSVVAFRFPGGREHLAVVKGDLSRGAPLVRVHSSCLTGDVLGSERCDCGAQLAQALQAIEEAGAGVLVYLQQEGRGIGLFNKIRAYTLQDEGANTVEANERLGFAADARGYEEAAAMLRHLDVETVRLLTNNPRKVEALVRAGIAVEERVPHDVGHNEENRAYLAHKRDLMGHLLG